MHFNSYRNYLTVNNEFIDDEISLAKRIKKSNFYLISNKLIEIYNDFFFDYNKIKHYRIKFSDLANHKFLLFEN